MYYLLAKTLFVNFKNSCLELYVNKSPSITNESNELEILKYYVDTLPDKYKEVIILYYFVMKIIQNFAIDTLLQHGLKFY